MSIPATLKVLGVIPAFVMIAIIACLADISVEILKRFTHAGDSTTYAGVMRSDVLSGNQPGGLAHLGVLQEWFGIHWWNSRAFSLLFIVVFVMLPLVLLRRVESLKFSSAISVLLALVFVGICSVMAISALVEGKTKTPRLLPQLNNHTSFFDLFTAVPVIVTSFTFHFNVHPIGFELNKPSDMILAAELCTSPYACVSPIELLLEAIFIPDIWTFFQFLGSTSAVSLALIFPGAIVLRDVHGISTTRDRITALVMIILAVVTSAIAISTNIVSFFGNNS
ncbi:hypothetical protein Pint_06620 [Pistacia integerrima]|uniref:Uncharacterized protein n=1 Tax=Pistacia integerrima TaxID=434235 RepID=A0ACC0Z5P9_9ROSI|nr:hypothetical protein Pint_06620 [Pistacia integerrima]